MAGSLGGAGGGARAKRVPPMVAIDFKALLREERERARAPRSSLQVEKTVSRPAGSNAIERPAPPISWSFRLPQAAHRRQLSEVAIVTGAPPTVWHMRDWLSEGEEAAMLRAASDAPQSDWVSLRGRRLQNLGGVPQAAPDAMIAEPLPEWIESVFDALVAAGVFPASAPPNHVLLNEYQPGQGIADHRDGPLYAPTVAILSLGSVCSFDFVTNDSARTPLASLLLPPRGLLVFTDDAYNEHLHRVPAITSDAGRDGLIRLDLPEAVQMGATEKVALPPPPSRTTRISLTVRRVLHVKVEQDAAHAIQAT